MSNRESRRYFRLPWRSAERIRADLDDELRLHLDLRTDELTAGGMAPADARREAEREFGDVDFTRRYCESLDRGGDRDARRREWLAELGDDARWTLRGIRHRPAYAALVALTLALGVGANTAVFSVVRAVLLHSLPYADAGRLVAIDELNLRTGVQYSDVSAAEYLDWTAATHSLAGVAAAGQASLTFAEGGTPELIPGRRVSANFLDVMGTTPALGRGFLAGEDRGVHRVILLTDGLWRRTFGADPNIVGRQVMLSGAPYTVIGVLRSDFMFPRALPQFLVPIDFNEMRDPDRARGFHFTHEFGRLRSGATIADARTELTTIAHRAEVAFPNMSTGHLVSVRPLETAIVGDVRPTMLLLAGAAGFVLLIACANVANLALARALARRREIAVRIALGANRGRIVRQILTESLVLSLIGGVAGTVVAVIATPALIATYPRALPPGFSVHLDGLVLAFALAISALAAIGFGLLPALSSGRDGVAPALRDGGRGATVGQAAARARRVLVVAQVSLAMVLLVGAGLLVRTLARVQAIDLGFDPTRLVAAPINLPAARYQTPETIVRFWNTLLDRVRREPGLANASIAGAAPLLGGSGTAFQIQGHETGGPLPGIRYTVAMDGYFAVIGATIKAGREFQVEDRTSTQPIVLINEAAAKKFWPGQNPIGANIRNAPDARDPWHRVVGVVADYRNELLDVEPEPLLITFAPQDEWTNMTLVIRTPKTANEVRRAVAAIIRQLDAGVAVSSTVLLPDIVRASSARRRFVMSLLVAFAVVALAVAVVGLYGVIAYGVATRRHEFGVRLALGATPSRVARMVLREGVVLASAGLLLGLASSAALTRFLSGLLFGVRPLDFGTFAGALLMLLAAAAGASWLPARKAAAVDPSRALRDD